MPQEEYDGRSFYEKLKETKDKKQEAFEEQLKFSEVYVTWIHELFYHVNWSVLTDVTFGTDAGD